MSLIREFILFTTERYYNVSQLRVDDKTEQVLSDFIHNSQTLLLQGFMVGDILILNTKICNDSNKSIVFYKTCAQDLNQEDAIKNINMMTLSASVTESLYQILRHIYSPLLFTEENLYTSKLQKNLVELESNLRVLTHGKEDGNISVILSIEDEVEYWKTIGQKSKSSHKERETAAAMCDFFQDISEEIRSLETSSMLETREIAENIGGILDDVWRFTTFLYPQDRMIHIFDIIGHILCAHIQKACNTLELWKINTDTKENVVLVLLSESLSVIQTWISACQSLTETYWPNYALHAWNGKPYVPPFCINFQTRLRQITEIRLMYSQLNKLLTDSEKLELKTHLLFEPFENINVWICNGRDNVWETAVSRFSAALRPAETKIAEKLKPRLHNTSTKQMLYEFMRYKALIERPIVKQALNNELETFVSSLISMLKDIQTQMDSDEMDVKMYQPPEMSPIVQQVQWAKQMEAKVKDIQACAEMHLKEFEGSAILSKLAVQVLKDLKIMYTQLHEEWTRDLQAQVKNGNLRLAMDKPVVEFSGSSKLMVVNFNPRLVWAELEARALAAAGLPPPTAAAALDALSNALVHARALQQVASFHNTLGERMIPSTRPMMLQAALDLSALVQDQKAVYWDDVEQLSNYTNKLKSIVLKLESQNTYLTSQHIVIRNIVEKLMDTELLAQQSEWKKQIKSIRDIIEKVEANGYKNTEAWRSHWDWQIYKALECQYIKTLLSLHKHFPHVKVDLVLRGHAVRVQPPIEEIRVQHYHQLRRLVSLPAQFVGLQNTLDGKQSVFNTIVDKHSWLGNKAVQQIEAALRGVQRACGEWSKRAALACVPDLRTLITERLRDYAHWQHNFKACKAYGQAVAKMDFEDEKIEWITIGTATLRRELEASARELWASLVWALQASCREHAASLDQFVAAARLLLQDNTLPKNAKELAEMSAKQQALQNEMPEMEKVVEELKRKSHMLRTWGGDASVEDSIKEWQKTREQMLCQQQMFEHQAEVVKTTLSGEWENLTSSVEAYASRWQQARGRWAECRGVSRDEALQRCRDVSDAHKHWKDLLANRDELMKECEKFNMNSELSPVWKEAEKCIQDYVALWTPFKDYNEEFESIAEQEWIVFQKKLHLLDEFVSKWSAQVEPYTTVTLYIQQEIEKFSDLTPLLKYLKGTDFTECHWREVFVLLGMEYKPPDTILVKDLLDVATNIKKQVKALQKICANASSEAAIRSALNELEVWYAGAKLTIVYYSDHAQRQTPIVKNFKDILSKVEEQQWVVSSVCSAEGGVGGASGAGGAGGAGGAWEWRLRAAGLLARAAHHAQRRWLYLEPILCNDDGELGSKFRKVDQGFRQVARIFEADPRLSALVQSSRLQSMLDSISEQLLACQSALNEYIDEKRSMFPRLYFLSDDDLLELLGQARAGAEGREVVMQTHLKKLFPGITGVRLGPGGMSITALCSHFDEGFQLDHPVDIDCQVEVWLKNLETEMRSSLRNMTLKCVVTNSLQEQDPFSLPTQILCLAQNIRFTEQAEKAIVSKELHKLKANVEKEKSYYATTDVDDEGERHKRQALILQCAHYVSVIKVLIENNVVSTSDWLWQKQLRFYLLNNKEVVSKMGLAEISYSYEYLGVNTGQFVRTETTDECFLILTQSLYLGLVGNPFGPAGTGKTESVKALGGLVGRLVLVFNCDEAIDAECMGRLLSGLALSGAWGCFDEFNRLSADTLAAVSHQLASLLPAIQQNGAGNSNTAVLNGKQVVVSAWCGVAATMNPVSRGYGGRRALPGALSRALLPAAAPPPPPLPLAARLLSARALPRAHALAELTCEVFTLASELLSTQRHYDWGLRALKAAVGSCGAALAVRPNDDFEQQLRLTRRLLALNNISKLTAYDADRFDDILSLVFGKSKDSDMKSDPIRNALEVSIDTLGLMKNNNQLQKCMELYEQMQQRMGVAIVGPPGSGKTTIRQLLKAALTHQGKSIVEYVISPKAMCREWLLGHIDHDTRQWTDGVISTTALEITNQPPEVWSWVVLDGSVDPEWVEALNSVLDDNRLLTLPSGARLHLNTAVNFIFESDCLQHASPATVSRLGIVLLRRSFSRTQYNPKDLYSDDDGYAQGALQSWIRKKESEDESTKMVLPLLQETIVKCLQWFNKHRSDMIVKICHTTMIRQIFAQFSYASQNAAMSSKHVPPDELVCLAVQRSVIGIIKENVADSFYEDMGMLRVGMSSPAEAPAWQGALLVSRRLRALEPALHAALRYPTHLLLVGPSACGKNLLIDHVLKDTDSTVIQINCTPITEPTDIIAELKRSNVVRTGGRSGEQLSGETGGSRAVLVLRGLDRTPCDAWGCSALLQFLLQVMQQGGFWSVCGAEGAAWSGVRVRVLAAARRTPPDARLTARLHTLVLPDPDEDELLELTKTSLKNNVDKNIPEKEVSNLANTILLIFKEVTESFDSRPHYQWNASHLMTWCESVKWYSPSNMSDLLVALHAEANSVFRDRLITEDEKRRFTLICRNNLKSNLNDKMYFMPKLRGDGVYLEMVDHKDWYQKTQKLINQCLTDNEITFGEMGVEVCTELSVLCSAMARATSGGLVTCVGSAGVGRRAAAFMVAAALPANLFFVDQPKQFDTQLRNAVASAGEGTRTLVVLGEWACERRALGAVEALRAAQLLQPPQAMHALPAHLRPHQCTARTAHNIKENLGIVICLDKNQDDLWDLMEKFPLLYDDGRLLWLDGWSNETLRVMPSLIINRLMKEDVSENKDERHPIPVDGFVNIYSSIDSEVMRAPCRYVNFIKTYYHVMSRKRSALIQRQKMLNCGVEALRSARASVGELQKKAGEQRAEVSARRAAAASALDQISATVRHATHDKEHMHTLKKNIEIENEKLQIRKKEIEAELASVEPVIEAARAAVGDIRPESLSEIRSLRAPPDVVRDILEGVLRLMGIADTSWHSMKNFLSKRGVKEDIRCLDASQISSEAAASVSRLLAARGASFEAGAAKRASAACAPLAAWVRANLHYAEALARVRPLLAQQHDLHRNLEEAEAQLSALSSGLESVEERVSELKQQLAMHSREAAASELQLATISDTIRAATDLLDRLADEYTAWENDLEYISKEIAELNQRSLLAAGYIVYLPHLTEPQAREYITKWSALVNFDDSSFSVINFLSSIEKQLKWEADGLPSDETALKNAVLVDKALELPKCGLMPLIVDPDGDAIEWLKKTLADMSCDFVSQNSDKLQTAVQYAVRLGRVLVITEVTDVRSAYACAAGARVLLQCRAPPRALPPRVAASLAELHFAARLHPLTDQLIHYALQQQNSEVIEKCKEIKLQKATLQKQQCELQEEVLRALSTKSDILKDGQLMSTLTRTRETGTTVASALQAAAELETERRAASAAYATSAARAARLALAVRRLAETRPLLALPADAVLQCYAESVRAALPTQTKDTKTPNNEEIVKNMTRRIIERVLLASHKKDKYVVVLYLLKEVYEDEIPEKLWQLFLNNYSVTEDQEIIDDIKRSHSWVPQECLKQLAQIKVASEELFKKLSLHEKEMWCEFQKTGDLTVLTRFQLTPFETVLATAVLRRDSLYRAIVELVEHFVGGCAALGAGAVRACARAARCVRPALALGSHALDVLAAHARSLAQVGVCEGRAAWAAALSAARRGGWLAVVVGASPFTTELQQFVLDFTMMPAEDFSEDFRLWIVSEDRDIPPLISNVCINVILEAPEGVKPNVLSTLSAWGGYSAEPAVVRMHACLALFHALAQERRAYIPLGWSQWYSWEWGDVSACARVVRSAGRGAARALCVALYGARVCGAADRVLVAALARACLGDAAFAHQWRPHGMQQPLPLANNLQAYVSAFDALPDIDTPQLLGLPANCRIAWEKTAANDIVSGLKELNSTVDTNKESARDLSPLKPLLMLWKKLMSGNPLIKEDFQIKEEARGWWGAACAGEARDAARAARALHAALSHAQRHAAYAQSLALAVPEEWQILWAGPETPYTYIKEFCYRARAAVARLDACKGGDFIPKEVDLRGFMRASRVPTALRAHAAARNSLAPHTLVLAALWDAKPEEKSCEDGVLVRGLNLSGAVWERGSEGGALAPAPPHAAPHESAPPLLLRYAPQGGQPPLLPEGTLEVPLYASAARDQLVCWVRAPLARHYDRDTAILNAVALYIASVD